MTALTAQPAQTTPVVKPTILVVDDTPLNIDVLKGLLNQQYIVRPAINGELALRLSQIEPLPSIILLDVMMPGMDGYEVCEKLKANPKTQDIPVIFITAETAAGNEIRGLELGAVDFLGKPIVPAVVLARINTHLTLQATRKELQEKNLILAEEKEQLEEIVEKMRTSAPFEAHQLRYVQFALEKTAGDIILSARRPDGTQHVLVCDFSGHGLPAALGGALAPYIFYRMTQNGNSLQEILTEINQVLYSQLPTQLYMAACGLEIAANRSHVNVWNYGLPAAVYLNSTSNQPLQSLGLPLGITNNIETFTPHQQLTTQIDDAFYVYTDGLTEATSPTGEQYGTPRLTALLSRIYEQKLPLETAWQDLELHCRGGGLADDAVLVEIRC